jgi:outer membrane protein assembly factor BamD (BamD/ComL family)
MIAEALFEQKKFDDATKEFTLAVYGYGGRDAVESVKPWQAFAAYELARCHLVQVSTADDAEKPRLIREAKNWFNYLIEHYPDDRLTVEAKNQIAKLEKM